jgi:glutamate carboxypeptidase
MTDRAKWFQSFETQMVSEVIELCEMNSGSDNTAGLSRVEAWLESWFASLGWPCHKIDLPSWETTDDLAKVTTHRTTRALRWDWTGSKTNDRTPRVLMSIHYDTVYGLDSPFQTCSHIERKGIPCLQGPGVIDAKGGIVIIHWALQGARQFLDMDRLKLSVILTPDEEIGSPATMSLWQSIASEFSFAMLYEPTLPDGSWVSHRKGTGTFLFAIHGKAAHSGRNFHDGRNAILHASRLAQDIDALNGIHPNVTINVGRIRGGDAVNVVPDLCVMRVNARVSDQAEQQWIESEMRRLAAKWNQESDGYQVEVQGGIMSAPKERTDILKPWMERVERVNRQLGHNVQWKQSGGASDGNKLAVLGLPNIDTFGPAGDLLHTDREWLRISSLPEKAHVSMAFLEDLYLPPR